MPDFFKTAPFTFDGLRRGMRDGVPLGQAALAYGLAFGLVAAQVPLALPQAVTMSAAVYSGSAQLAALNLIQTGYVTLTALAATILLMNARYVMFSAALQPWLGQTTALRAYGSLLLLGDANWLLVMRAIDKGEADRAYLAGTGVPMLVGWLGGTSVGVLSGSILPDPRVLAADLMLPAFAAAMMGGMMRGRASYLAAGVGGGVALAVMGLAGPGWAIIAAGVAGAAVAAAAWRAPVAA